MFIVPDYAECVKSVIVAELRREVNTLTNKQFGLGMLAISAILTIVFFVGVLNDKKDDNTPSPTPSVSTTKE